MIAKTPSRPPSPETVFEWFKRLQRPYLMTVVGLTFGAIGVRVALGLPLPDVSELITVLGLSGGLGGYLAHQTHIERQAGVG